MSDGRNLEVDDGNLKQYYDWTASLDYGGIWNSSLVYVKVKLKNLSTNINTEENINDGYTWVRYTLDFTMEDEEYDINLDFSVKLYIKDGKTETWDSADDIKDNIEELEEYAEEEVQSNGLFYKVVGGGVNKSGDYDSVSGGDTINLTFERNPASYVKTLDFFLYFEKSLLSTTDCDAFLRKDSRFNKDYQSFIEGNSYAEIEYNKDLYERLPCYIEISSMATGNASMTVSGRLSLTDVLDFNNLTVEIILYFNKSAWAWSPTDYITVKINFIETDGGERNDTNFVDVITNMDYYNPDSTDAPTSSSEYYKKASVLLTIVTNVAIILSVIMSAVIGVKYMLGSVEERADYKKTLLPYFVGALLVFGISTVIKILQGIGESINNI